MVEGVPVGLPGGPAHAWLIDALDQLPDVGRMPDGFAHAVVLVDCAVADLETAVVVVAAAVAIRVQFDLVLIALLAAYQHGVDILEPPHVSP